MPAADLTPSVRVLPGWVLAGVSATAGLLLARTPPILADPSPCPGLSELFALGIFTVLPTTPAGAVLMSLHAAGGLLGLLAFWRLAADATHRPLLATSVTLGVAFTWAFVWRLAPTLTLAFAAASIALLYLARASRPDGPLQQLASRRATVALAVTAACLPPLTLALSAVAGWHAWRDRGGVAGPQRWRATVASAGTVLALPLVVLWLLPAPPETLPVPAVGGLDCLVPLSPSLDTVLVAATRATSRAGLLVLALALLGIFGTHRWMPDRAALAALVVLPVAAALLAPATVPGLLVPTVVVGWALAAIGLRELTDGAHRRSVVVGALVAVLLPVQQVARWAFLSPDERLAPFGHTDLTAAFLEDVVSALPPDAALVNDDAASALLIRQATAAWQRTGKTPLRVERRVDDVRAALTRVRVFALRRAQRTLPHQGFRLTTDLRPPIPGIAEVRPGEPCVALSTAWLTADTLRSSERLAIVALDAEARGPVTIFLGSREPFRPSPLDWPDAATRGFDVTTFDVTDARGRRQLEAQRQLDGLASDQAVFGFPHVLRLEIWRIPGAPLTLPVGLGVVPDAALARPAQPSGDPRMLLCPSLPFQPVAGD